MLLMPALKRVANGRAQLRSLAPGQHISEQKSHTEVASRWRHCVRFDRPDNRNRKPSAPSSNVLPPRQPAGA